jgi:hypothetical protein
MKLTNNTGQPVLIDSLVVGVSDAGLLTQIGLSASASSIVRINGAMTPLGVLVQPATPGTATLTFTTPLPISATGLATLDFSATISASPGLSKSSTQAVVQVNATMGGHPISVGVLPTVLGTVTTP